MHPQYSFPSFIIFLKYWRRIGHNYRNTIVVGYGELARELRKFFIFHPEHGYKFRGYFDEQKKGTQIKGNIEDLFDYALNNNIHEIYCCLPNIDPVKVHEIIDFAEEHFIKIKIIPDFRGFPYKNLEVQLYDYIPVLKVRPQPLDDKFNQFIKRSFDFVFSDADKGWYTQYFKDVDPKLKVGGCFTAHNVANAYGGIKDFLDYVEGLDNYNTSIDKTSRSGVSISYKKSE